MTGQYSNEMLQDQIHLTKYMEMSGDQAEIPKGRVKSGMSTRDMPKEVVRDRTRFK